MMRRCVAGAFVVCLCIVLSGTALFGMGSSGRKQPEYEKVSMPSSATSEGKIPIGDILNNPAKFSGTEVTLKGAFRGWKAACPDSFMTTRSDWIVEDETGCIYVNGSMPPGLSPAQPHAEYIQVTGQVIADKKGKLALKASQVTQVEKQ